MSTSATRSMSAIPNNKQLTHFVGSDRVSRQCSMSHFCPILVWRLLVKTRIVSEPNSCRKKTTVAHQNLLKPSKSAVQTITNNYYIQIFISIKYVIRNLCCILKWLPSPHSFIHCRHLYSASWSGLLKSAPSPGGVKYCCFKLLKKFLGEYSRKW